VEVSNPNALQAGELRCHILLLDREHRHLLCGNTSLVLELGQSHTLVPANANDFKFFFVTLAIVNIADMVSMFVFIKSKYRKGFSGYD
jgi:hypothetical protein